MKPYCQTDDGVNEVNTPMTNKRQIVRRLQRVVDDAKKSGFVLIADADAMGIRMVTREEEQLSEDLRETGEVVVALHGGCGGGIAPQKTGSGSG